MLLAEKQRLERKIELAPKRNCAHRMINELYIDPRVKFDAAELAVSEGVTEKWAAGLENVVRYCCWPKGGRDWSTRKDVIQRVEIVLTNLTLDEINLLFF